ncbi:hypothetical protein BGZ94_004487 [Podila epigama]|nr:hypothetical protein BGZ94_004487 [Podila epigama]
MLFRPSSFVLVIALALVSLLSVVVAAPITALPIDDIQILGQEYQVLRTVKGHWDGGEFSEEVDAFNGKKHQVMQQLAAEFAKPGVLESKIVKTMGRPDSIPTRVLKELKKSEPEVTINMYKYIVFKWRGYHDFLWFRIDDRTHKVVQGEWYYALE